MNLHSVTIVFVQELHVFRGVVEIVIVFIYAQKDELRLMYNLY